MLDLNLREIFTVSMILFAVIDIIGSIPVIINLKNKVGHIHAEKATVVSLFIMIGFLFLGESILGFIGLDISSFAIAGSFVIFFIAIEMILGIKLYRDEVPATASIVPLAFPLIAGTGTMTTLLSIRAQYSVGNVVVGIFLNLVFVYLVLRNVKHLERWLGTGGMSVLRKVFGVVLLAISVKLFKSNIGLH